MSKEATENQDRVVNMKKQTQFSAREMRTENVQGQETSWQQMSRKKIHGFLQLRILPPFWMRSLTELVFIRNCLSLCLRFLLLLLSAYMHHSKQTNKNTFKLNQKSIDKAHASLHLMLSCPNGVLTVSLLKSRKLRLRKTKSLAQSHNSNLITLLCNLFLQLLTCFLRIM